MRTRTTDHTKRRVLPAEKVPPIDQQAVAEMVRRWDAAGKITKCPPSKARKGGSKRKREPKGMWALRRAEFAARVAEENRYAKLNRRLAGQKGARYEPQVIEHNGLWAVSSPTGEIIKDSLTNEQAWRFVDRSRRFVTWNGERKDRI